MSPIDGGLKNLLEERDAAAAKQQQERQKEGRKNWRDWVLFALIILCVAILVAILVEYSKLRGLWPWPIP